MVVWGGELEDAQNGKRKEDIDKQSHAKRIGMLYIKGQMQRNLDNFSFVENAV